MKALLVKLGGLLMQAVLVIGQWSTNVACGGEFYQPVVPEKMLSKKEVNETKDLSVETKYHRRIFF